MKKIKKLVKLVRNKISIKALRDFLLKSIRLVATALIALLVIVNLVLPINKLLENNKQKQTSYILTLLVERDIGLVPVGQIFVKNVTYQGDSICFETLQTDTKNYLKFPIYQLKEVSVQ